MDRNSIKPFPVHVPDFGTVWIQNSGSGTYAVPGLGSRWFKTQEEAVAAAVKKAKGIAHPDD